ncbi:MAG: ribosome maturation factor RimP [Steroidobacteraceae bacterium]
MASTLRNRLIELTEPLLGRLGYELVEIEFVPGRSHSMVRVFLDKVEGIGVEDCERASRELSALFDVEDPIPTAYTLEVSSPGLDRVLRLPAHFVRFIGERIHAALLVARDGRRNYTGALTAVNGTGFDMNVDGNMVSIEFAQLEKARLSPVLSDAASARKGKKR